MSDFLEHRPADIVLVRSSSSKWFDRILAKLTMVLDRSPYTHSALAVDAGNISHATVSGSKVDRLDDVLAPDGIVHFASSYELVGMTDEQRDAVVAIGRRMGEEQLEYSEIQLVLTGVMLTQRAVPWRLMPLVAVALEAFTRLVNRCIDRNGPLVTCSDYVYAIFDEAAVEVLPDGLPGLGDPMLAGQVDAGEVDADDVDADDEFGERRGLDDWLADTPTPLGGTPAAPSPFDDVELDDLGSVLRAELELLVPDAIDDDGIDLARVSGDEVPPERVRNALDAARAALARPGGTGLAAAVDRNLVTPGDLARSPLTRRRARFER
ncbi:MAG: hypothetical protein AAGG08_11905 [Actinomycetota bacterium]